MRGWERLKRKTRPVWIALAIPGLFSCDRIPFVARPEPKPAQVVVTPTKEDVFFLDSEPFTLAEYYALKEHYPTLSPENILRLAAYARFIWKDSREHPASMASTLKDATEAARALLLPRPPGDRADAVRQNQRAAEEALLRERLERAHTQWNPGLLREIGASAKPWG